MLLPLALGLALGASDVSAQIQWEAPLECPDRRWLRGRVEAYLGRPLDRGDVFSLELRVEARHGGFALELATEVAGSRTRQTLEHHDCARLTEQAASLAAISIDPLALPRAPVSPPPSSRLEQPAPGPVVQRPASRTAPAEAPRVEPRELGAPPEHEPGESLEREPVARDVESPLLSFGALERIPEHEVDARPSAAGRTRLTLGAVGGLALNVFPNPAPQLRASVGVQRVYDRGALQVELDGEAILAGRFRSADGSTGGDLLAWDLGLRPCGAPRWGIVELRVCGALGAGQVRAQGVGVDNSIVRAHPWVWLGADAGVAVEVQRNVALVLAVDARFSVYRPNFSVSNPDASYQTPVFSSTVRAGVELRLF